jgi:hypothetical protein
MKSELSVIYVPLSSLTAFPKNARTHSKQQIRQLAASMKEFGFTNPVLVDQQNTIMGLIKPVSPPPGNDKIIRLYAHSAKFESGFVWLPTTAPWLAEYVRELNSSTTSLKAGKLRGLQLILVLSRPRAGAED